MAEGLKTADGTPVEIPEDAKLAAQFDQAMNAPEPTDPAMPAPPKREADPAAPYGRTKDGRPKKGPGGRPPKAKDPADRPRVQPAAGAGAQAEPRDYREGLGELVDGAWSALVAFDTPQTKAQAAILHASSDGLVNGLNLAAANNAMVRRGVEAVTKTTWVMVVGMAVMPFAQMSIALWTGKIDADAVAQLAEATERVKEQRVAKAQAEMVAAAQAAAA